MKQTVRSVAMYIIAAVLAALLLLSTLGGAILSARAEEGVKSYDESNVMDDLEGATIGGKLFDIADYPANSSYNLSIISFVEYGYSYYSNSRSDYGLYIYVYNPQGIDIKVDSVQNRIELRAGSEHYGWYPLTFLNMSEGTGQESIFLKYRVELTESERMEILSTLDRGARVYEVIGIELLTNGDIHAIDYAIAQTYTYSGYASGYGALDSSESTLNCTVDSINKYLTLDVQSTYWRPDGTHSDGYTRDTLHSVYFAVPNDIIEEYGEITAVHASWLNAYTAPIFVTGNETIYNALSEYVAQYVNGGSRTALNPNTALKYVPIATKAIDEIKDDTEYAPYTGYYAFNHYTSSGYDTLSYGVYDNPIYYLNYLFYAENGNADEYVLSAEKLLGNKDTGEKGWLETFSEKYGTTGGYGENDFSTDAGDGAIEVGSSDSVDYTKLVCGKYSRALFAEVDDSFTDVNIESTDSYKLTDNVVSNSVWDKLFGNQIQSENTYELSAIQKVTGNDISIYSSREVFCNKFYISESDYDKFCEYVVQAEENDRTVYLFRYYQSEYVSHEVTEYQKSTRGVLFGSDEGDYKYIDTNAYFCQMWIQLDFDIIDVTFTKDNVNIVIPVVSSPMDIAADAEPPVNTMSDGGCNSSWLTILFIVIAVVVILLILIFIPIILKVVIWIIALPFKAIAAIFKGIKKATKKESKKDTGQSSENAKQAAKRAKKAAKEANKAAKQAKKATKKKE